MKKTVKQIISALVISGVTLAAGFAITGISFNLFDNLTSNQMKVLFAIDILSLAVIATSVWYFFEMKRIKARRKRLLEKRHKKRIEQFENDLKEINKLIDFSNFAA